LHHLLYYATTIEAAGIPHALLLLWKQNSGTPHPFFTYTTLSNVILFCLSRVFSHYGVVMSRYVPGVFKNRRFGTPSSAAKSRYSHWSS